MQAITDYDQAIALNPRYADAYCSRGLVRLRQGDETAAARDFKQCLALNPNLKASLERFISKERAEMTVRK